jgi:predicted nucleotidyltransferase
MGIEGVRMKEEILAALEHVEQQDSVRILCAVESGSRAWGFASQDSDYDVRFIYAHPRDWYLSVFEQRDVIEPHGDDLLDPSGWDLRKALRLFSKCNLALNEWLNSPIVYREISGFRSQLQALMPAYFNPIAAIHHYSSMAKAALDAREGSGAIKTKKLFYALRALFACRWIERDVTQPPTEFNQLLESVADENERAWIADLLAKKVGGHERDETRAIRQYLDRMAGELATFENDATRAPRPTKAHPDALDVILRQWAN